MCRKGTRLVRKGYIETFLSVPADIIFLRMQGRPLLTSAEAHSMLKISCLARELDYFLVVAEKRLRQRHRNKRILTRLDRSRNPLLRSVSLVAAVSETLSCPGMILLRDGISRVLAALASQSTTMKQSAEQNWSVSDSIVDTSGNDINKNLVEGKRSLADVEDEISRRIDRLLAKAKRRNGDSVPTRELFHGNSDSLIKCNSIEAFCREKLRLGKSYSTDAGGQLDAEQAIGEIPQLHPAISDDQERQCTTPGMRSS